MKKNVICTKKVFKSLYNSPLGTIILTSDGQYLTNLCFTTSRFKENTNIDDEQICDKLEVFKLTKKWLDEYFAKKNPNPEIIPTKLYGTEFSMKVWKILKTIPYGKTITYKEIANILIKQENLKNMSAQAVGHAVGHNPICIIIPCHRVMGANGNLTGYGEGIDKKIKLLELENVDTRNFYIPKKGTAL